MFFSKRQQQQQRIPTRSRSMKIVIEATAKKLILQGGILRSRIGDEIYHFKQVTHPDSIKIYVCHTARYCAQHSNLTCACTTSVDLSDFDLADIALRGNNNELYLEGLGVLTGDCCSFSMGGKQNNVEMRISRRKLIIIMSGIGAAQGEHHLTLAGVVEELAINSTRYFGLNAEHLTVVTSALINCRGQDLIKVMLKPRVLSGDFRVRNEAAPARPALPPTTSTSTSTTTTPQTAAPPPQPQNRRKRAPKESSAKRTRLPADSHATCIAHKEEMRLQACSICLENVPNWVCVPCGHMLCPRCTSLLCNKLKSSSQLLLCSQAGCNQKVEQVVRAILPFSSSSSSSSSHTKPTLLSGSLSPTDMETISLDDE